MCEKNKKQGRITIHSVILRLKSIKQKEGGFS